MSDQDRYYQTVIIETDTGKRAVYTGQCQLDEGDKIKTIKMINAQPLPDDCHFESIKRKP